MPWIELALADPARGATLGPALAGAVARALDLGPADVLVRVRAREALYDGRGSAADEWPAATLHGRARAPEAMDRARRAATTLLADAHGVAEDRVWVHWCTG